MRLECVTHHSKAGDMDPSCIEFPNDQQDGSEEIVAKIVMCEELGPSALGPAVGLPC